MADDDAEKKVERRVTDLKPGQRLREADLVEELQIPRGVVRRALARFESRGLIKSLKGRGWRVPHIYQRTQVWLELNEYSLTKQLKEKHGVACFNKVVAAPAVCKVSDVGNLTNDRIDGEELGKGLNLGLDSNLLWFARLRCGEDETGLSRLFALEYTFLPRNLFASSQITKEEILLPGRLTEIIEEAGFGDPETHPAAYASFANIDESKLLELREGAPILCVKTINSSQRHGRREVFEWTLTLYCPNVGIDVGYNQIYGE